MNQVRTFPLAGVLLVASLGAPTSPEVYVANYDDHTVSVLDARTLLPVGLPIPITPTPTCPEDPENLLGNPDAPASTRSHRYVFVTIDFCDKIAVIDTSTHTVVKYIEAAPGSLETQIFLRPPGDRMYVTTCGFPTVAVIDVRTQEMIDVIELPFGGGTYDMAFSPNGRIGYVGNFSDQPIPWGCGTPMGFYRLNLRNNTVIDHIPTSRNVVGVAVSKNGRVALATTQEDVILVIDVRTRQEVGAVMCGTDPCVYGETHGVGFSADETRAYVIDAGTNELITLDTRRPLEPTELSRTPITGLGTAWELDISTNRLHVILYGEPSEVAVFDISRATPVQLLAVGIAGVNASELDTWSRGGAGSGGGGGGGGDNDDDSDSDSDSD